VPNVSLVCGGDKKTYGNDCLRKCAGVSFVDNGACVEELNQFGIDGGQGVSDTINNLLRDCNNCPNSVQPVCANDGST